MNFWDISLNFIQTSQIELCITFPLIILYIFMKIIFHLGKLISIGVKLG